MKKYETIYNDIANKIFSGKLKLGDTLESEIFYQKKYDASRFTVRNAISLLEKEGYIQKSKGKPSIVINNVPRKKNILFITQFMGRYLFGELVYKIENTLKENGYNTIISFSYSDKLLEKQNLENLLPIADGIIIDPTQTQKYKGVYLENYSKLTTKPSVSISAPIFGVNIPSLLTNDFEVMKYITHKLILKGQKNILIVNRDVDYQGHCRLEGILNELNETDVHYHVIVHDEKQHDSLAMEVCLQITQAFYDTIMFFNDQCAYSFIDIAEKQNINLDDIIITGFDGIPNKKYEKKIVSPIYPLDDIAADVASTLIALFDGKTVESKVYDLEILNEDLLN